MVPVAVAINVFAEPATLPGVTDYPSREEGERQAAKLCPELPGYDTFKAEFAFGQPPFVGGVNMFPLSIYAWIHTKRPRLIDSVWWWDPVDDSGKPRVDWNQFRAAYEDASGHLSAYSSWLTEWKRAERGRKVELHLFGTDIGESDFQMKEFILPEWKAAGFKGQPGYSVLLRRPDGSWIHVLFGRDESKALVTESFVRPKNGRMPHWLDTFNVSFNPNGRRGEADTYVVVAPSGEHELVTYANARPAAPTPPITPSYGGGDGSSVDSAVVIHAPDEKTGVWMEHDYLQHHFPGFKFKTQSLFISVGSKKRYDKIEFRQGKKNHTIYFEVSSYSWGKMGSSLHFLTFS
ncbi:MAG: hypothetical protein QOH39_233 [Verrucomicrobiota bacterium]|jgi:hypothetical protein